MNRWAREKALDFHWFLVILFRRENGVGVVPPLGRVTWNWLLAVICERVLLRKKDIAHEQSVFFSPQRPNQSAVIEVDRGSFSFDDYVRPGGCPRKKCGPGMAKKGGLVK